MIDRALAIFSGVHPKVVARLTPALRSVGIEPVSVSVEALPTESYFECLAKQALHVADRQRVRGDVRLTSVLVSALNDSEREVEADAFFPALRRITIRPEWRNNPSAAGHISRLVQDYFKSEAVRDFSRRIASNRENRMLMPRRNTPCKGLGDEFLSIYHRDAEILSAKIEKDIVALRSGRGLKVSNLTFKPTLNNGQHPVRRCTESNLCDLKAAFRFGVGVQQRFEFDVTSDNGFKSKSFLLCDGSLKRITVQVTHLNMRINDDFKEG